MAFGTMTSRVLGQVRESLLAYYFDKRITDAFAAAFRVPNLFRRLLGEGSLSVSFIPVFVDANLDSHKRAQNLVNSVYTFLLIILGILLTLGFIYPEFLLRILLDAKYIADVEKFALTVRLARIMFGFLFFISSYAFMMGILNALGQYALPAMAPTFLNIAMILFTMAPNNWFAVTGDQLAMGVLVGGVLQALILVPALFKSGFLPKLTLDFSNTDFRRVLKSMGPGLLGLGLLQITTIINLRFSSSLQEGTISIISYVDRLIELPLSLVSVSLGTALLPALSQFKSRGMSEQFAQTSRRYLELNLLMTMAASAGLFTLAHPIVQLLFGRGRFGPDMVDAASAVLQTYCWIMIFSSGVRVLTPAYYAVKNTWFPATTSCVCLVVHIFLAPTLMARYQVQGLMISTTVSAFLNFALLLGFYKKLIGEFEFTAFIKNIFMYVFLAAVTAAAAGVYFLFELGTGGTFRLFMMTFGSVAFAVAVFISVGYVCKITAVHEVVERIRRRVKK